MTLDYTSIDEIPDIVDQLHRTFRTRKLDSLQYRLNQIRNVYFAVKDNVDSIIEALHKDFNRSASETKSYDVVLLLAEMLYIMDNLEKWSKPEPIKDIPLTMAASKLSVLRVPLGVVLVISPFNYPLFLAVSPVIGAIAGGNCVVLKPPESTPHFSALLSQLLSSALDPDIFAMVNGAVKETNVLLEQKFDKIFYTGGGAVGRIVATAAAKHLTPVVLELGGKSPAIISKSVTKAELPAIVRRIAWARFTNSGQTCVAVDYVLCHESLIAEFAATAKKVLEEEFYPNLSKDDPSYTHVIHQRAFDRVVGVIKRSKGVLVTGGKTDRESNFISPTVLSGVEWDDSTMEDELFGPVLPILSYGHIQEAIDGIIEHHDTPLASYIYGGDKQEIELLSETLRSGATVMNDAILHVALYPAPFGGVGQSGYGNYHGYYSFRTFTHEKTIMYQPMWSESIMKIRYPPANNKNDTLFWMTLLGNDKLWFDRTGDVNVGGANLFWKLWTGTGDILSLVFKLIF